MWYVPTFAFIPTCSQVCERVIVSEVKRGLDASTNMFVLAVHFVRVTPNLRFQTLDPKTPNYKPKPQTAKPRP